jgi:hypothetical protein
MPATTANPKSKIQSPKSHRLFTFASGGWVLLVTAIGCAILIAWAIAPAIMRGRDGRPPGDNASIDSYNFDLSNLAVPREFVVPATMHRDMVPAMDAPTHSGPTTGAPFDQRWEAMQRLNDPKYGKYLVAGDVVIGVSINGESRAYPLHVLYVHEIINDTLGGTPIAVTYNWPSAAAAVFDRRVYGPTTNFAMFAHSGLIYNCNLLMYDRNQRRSEGSPRFGAGRETLFSQLLGKAVAGSTDDIEAALIFIPHELVTWADWSVRHPETTVLNRDLAMFERYRDAAPTQYFNEPDPLTPVSPAPPEDSLAAKTQVMAVITSEACRVYPLPYVLDHATPIADAPGLVEWKDELGSRTLRFIGDRQAKTLRVEASPADDQMLTFQSFWFAWHAMHPEDELYSPQTR